jgi:hypothetical protein
LAGGLIDQPNISQARHMRVSLSTMRNKTGRNDECSIAQLMRLGWFCAVPREVHRDAKDAHAFGQPQAFETQAGRH